MNVERVCLIGSNGGEKERALFDVGYVFIFSLWAV